jgi:hypothetical protein
MTEHLSEQAQEIRRLMPRQSGSVILNDVSNYLMIGSAPLLVSELVSHIKGTPVSPTTAKLSGVAMLAGAGWGLFEGLSEASRLEEYRRASLKETSNLRHESDAQEVDIQNLKHQLELQNKEIENLKTTTSYVAFGHGHTHVINNGLLHESSHEKPHTRHISAAEHEGKAAHTTSHETARG